MKRKLTELIKQWKEEAGVKEIIQINACPTVRSTLTICTDRPGFMIGKGGCLIDKYREKIQNKYPNIKQKYRFELQNIKSVADKFQK